jgi:hypothetical protein
VRDLRRLYKIDPADEPGIQSRLTIHPHLTAALLEVHGRLRVYYPAEPIHLCPEPADGLAIEIRVPALTAEVRRAFRRFRDSRYWQITAEAVPDLHITIKAPEGAGLRRAETAESPPFHLRSANLEPPAGAPPEAAADQAPAAEPE